MILHGDCRQQLANLPDCSVDAIVTDPPYELGFMGKKWDASGIAYDPEVWGQCLRVLKPGAHLLAFGGTRTYHRMTCAIEDAGFEIRDSLHWLYGSGFPKSLDVSKAIDKAFGAEREVVGKSARHGGGTLSGPSFQVSAVVPNITAPATPAAAAAAGWGTALKPAHEPIVLARKPLVGTVAANVMEYGTGALNIDGCRVAGADTTTRHNSSSSSYMTGKIGEVQPIVESYTTGSSAGRWPANIILTHSAGCEQVGTRKVRTGTAVNRNRDPDNRTSWFGQRPSQVGDDMTYADADGTETVLAWNCVPGCPVATLNEQSGDLHPPGTRSKRPDRGPFTSGLAPPERAGQVINDRGGASRFFTTTEWDPELDVPFLYVAKPSRKERNAGLDGMPEKPGGSLAGGNDKRRGDKPQLSPRANFHPTVKPVALIRHLIRLITPPGGTVLDPFLGSGTTAVAAILEGFDWIGCELTDDYLPIIEARITWAEQNRPEPDLTLFTEQP